MNFHSRAALVGGLLLLALPARGDRLQARVGVRPEQPKQKPTAGQQQRDPEAEGRRNAEEAERLFKLGIYKEAAAAFQKAYVALGNPVYLFNMGQCYMSMGEVEHLEKAVTLLETFCKESKDAALLKRARQQIARLKRAIKAAGAGERGSTPLYKRWWFWVGMTVTVGAITAGVVLLSRPADELPVPGNTKPPYFWLP
jgi:tetratricopeptide (TPR) repeat protein